MVDSTDHLSPKLALAEANVTVSISKNLGALAAFTLTGKWAELGQGLYSISFAASDLNTVGFFAYLVTAPGSDQYSGMMYVADFTDYKADVSASATQATVDAIKSSTDNLPPDPADQSLLIAYITAEVDDLITRAKGLNEIYDSVALRALEATLTAMKGAGWTNETLKYIKELVDELETGEKPPPRAHFNL